MDDTLSHDESDDDGLPIISCAIDDVALAALKLREPIEAVTCNACDAPIRGEPAGRGLFMWKRGDDVQLEEPPLCPRCATAIGVSALRHFEVEEEEG